MAMYSPDGTKIGQTSCGDIVLPDTESLQKIVSTISELENALEKQSQDFRDYVSAQEAKQREDKVQRSKDDKKQRRHDWFIAIASAGLTGIVSLIVSLIVQHFQEILAFFQWLFQAFSQWNC